MQNVLKKSFSARSEATPSSSISSAPVEQPAHKENPKRQPLPKNILQQKYIQRTHAAHSTTQKKLPLPHLPSLPKNLQHFRHFPLLFFACFFYALCGLIFWKVQPTQIQNIFLRNSYAPLLVCSGIGHFFLASFLFLNVRRGAYTAFFLTLTLFLKLQHVETVPLFFLTLLPFIILESILTLLERAG
jgi:hypothetical protein